MSAAATEGRDLLSHDTFLTNNILLHHQQPAVLMDHQSTTPQADPIELQIPQLQLLDLPESSSPSEFSVVDPSLLGASPPSSPSAHGDSARQVKKRKSWGQVLPEPKTNLPPRKRAKTDDEKEQRRIERVKRNRLAAHNSRERKRVEMEDLQKKNDDLEAELNAVKAELAAMRNLVGGKITPGMSFAAPAAQPATTIAQAFTPPASVHTQTPSMLDDMATPCSDSFSQPPTPFEPTMDMHLETPDIFSLDDSEPTQHSAAMLCDLPCRSDASKAWMENSRRRMQAFQRTLAIFSLLLLQLQVSVMTAVSTTCSTWISSNSLRQRLLATTTQASQTPAISYLTRSLRALTPSQLHCLTTLMVSTARLLLCTPTKAPRHLLSATGVASRQKSSREHHQMLSSMVSGLLRKKLGEANDDGTLDQRQRMVTLVDDDAYEGGLLGRAEDLNRVDKELRNEGRPDLD